MLEIRVTGGEISEQEKAAYVERAMVKYKGRPLTALDIHIDGDFVELTYHETPVPFDRIRRITGYLVGGMDRWNNAKRADQKERGKHG